MNQDSDVFMLVEYPVGGDDDMPGHCWDRIIHALSEVFGQKYWECVVWLTNIEKATVDDEWVVIRA